MNPHLRKVYINVKNTGNKLWKLLNQIQLYEMPQEIVIAHGLIDSIGGDSKTHNL